MSKYKRGYKREDGKYFSGYTKNKFGKVYEVWRTEESWVKEQNRTNNLYKNNKEKILLQTKQRSAKNKSKDPIKYCAKQLLSGAKFRSKEKGIPFNLDLSFIEEKIKLGFCEATGLPFFVSSEYMENGKPYQSPYAPSLDQIKHQGGYTKDNIRVTILMFNVARRQWGDSDIVNMAKAICNSVTCGKYEKF